MVEYNVTTDPTESGVYACRVPSEKIPGFFTDVFLMWVEGRWHYIGSDQRYRGDVTGWVGPLRRKLLA